MTLKKAVAEFIGTFTLIFVGVCAIAVSSGSHDGGALVGVALAHGMAIGVMVSATMTISGGQLNPAVTLGLWVGRQLDGAQAAINVVAQLLGGLAGGLLAKAAVPTALWLAGGGGVPDLAGGTTPMQGVLLEMVGTFFLVFVVFGTGVDERFGGRIGGIAIGTTIMLDILAFGPLTGSAVNPARWFGAAIPAAHYSNAMVYWMGPLLGGLLAGLVYGRFLLVPEPKTKTVAA
jgi:MIP family channel proteins